MMVMVKNSDIQVIIAVVVFCLLLFVFQTEANPKKPDFYNSVTQNYYNENNNSVQSVIASFDENTINQQPTEIVCPEDISTYTDINTCSSHISIGLNLQFPENSLTLLSWEMAGANIDSSEKNGINQIDNYTFNEGVTTVTYTAKDKYTNITTCSFTVTIWDNQVPRLENMPGDITVSTTPGECSASVSWLEPTASDNCSQASEIVTDASVSPGSVFPVGKTTVNYTALDAMGNQSATQSFIVTVQDNESPQVLLPNEITIDCEDEIPAPWQTFQQLTVAGGYAIDNCEIDETSFQLLSENSDSESCPYTITRTYEISDVNGNISTAEYLIYVAAPKGDNNIETPVLKSRALVIAAVTSGDWSDPNTWGGTVPGIDDDVIIPNGISVNVDIDAYCFNINIESGGTLNHAGAYTLYVNGNWNNYGTYNGGANGIVEFTGTSLAKISGNTTFEELIINKNSLSTTFEIEGDVIISSSGSITLNNGLVDIVSGGSLSINQSNDITIPQTAGFELTGGTLNTGDLSIINEGLIRINSGTANIGTNSGNSVQTQANGAFIVSNGTVNISGRLENTASGTLDPSGLALSSGINISGGNITLATVGNDLSNTGSLNVTSNGTFDFTGGTIIFQNPNTTSPEMDLNLISGSSSKNTTGGTFQFGNSSTPAGSTFNIYSDVTLDNISSTSNTDILLNSNILVNQLNLGSGSGIGLNGNALQIATSSNGTYDFLINDENGNLIPVSINMTGDSFASGAYIQLETSDNKYSENASSVNYLNRYWTITTSGITTPTYDITATYSNTDVVGSESEIAMGSWSGSLPWQKHGDANSTANTITASGVTGTNIVFTGITSDSPTVTVSADNNTICIGSSATLTASATGDPVLSYSWTSNPSGTTGMTSGITVNPATTTIYIVEVTDGNGFTASDNLTVNVNPIPTVTIPADKTYCINETTAPISLSGTPSGVVYDISGGTAIGLADQTDVTQIPSFITITGNATVFVTPKANGCTGTTQTFTITVEDVIQPVVSNCPADIYQGVTSGSCDATVSWTPPSATDNCTSSGNLSWTSNHSPGETFPVGTTSVSYTVTDEAGLQSTCSFDVIITDDEAPVVNCPSNITATTDAGSCNGTVSVIANVVDNCSGVTVTNDFNSGGADASGSYPLGTTTVTFTATDAAGNSSGCSVDVTIQDNEDPVVSCPVNITQGVDAGTCEATITNFIATFSDNCTGGSISNSFNTNGADASGTYPVGTTNVTFSATDAAGNTSAPCSATITVVDDETPVKPTLSPIFETCSVTLADHPAPTTTDNCDGTITGTTTTSFPITAQGLTTIVWTFTDSNGNHVTANQQVSIEDDESPKWDDLTFFTSTLNLSCVDDTTVAGTGIPTATDNCSSVTTSYTTSVTSQGCPGRYSISRTWTATDATGNKNTKVQTIYVNDTEDPVLICRDTTVANKDEIFDPYGLHGISFSDNCGIDTVYLVNEWFTIGSEVSGFCPEEVYREYTVIDKCGNYSNNCTQTISVASNEGCDLCQESVPKFLVNLNGVPDSTWVLDDKITREGACCQTDDSNTAWGCISFNVYLDKDAVGVIMDIRSPAPPGDSEYYRIDCSDTKYKLDSTICLAGGQFYTLTFCKPGEDKPIYTIQSIQGAITPDSLTTRADVDCFGELYVGGLEPGTIEWTVSYPAGADSLTKYLSDPYSDSPVFTPDANTPALIKYEVCGQVAGFPECDGVPITDCAEVVVNVLPAIEINLDVDLTTICENEIPLIHAEIPNMDSELNYTFEWYDGPDGTGTLVSTDPNYQPTDIGTYSVIVTEVTTGVGCNRDLTNFNIAYDLDGPSMLVPPDTLFLDCSVTDFDAQVVAWIATAEAHDLEDTTLNVTVQNDYTSVSPACGLTQVVHFWAEDNCGNISQDSAVIYVSDDIDPVINVEASDEVTDCATIDPNENPDYLAWLSAHGGASATDDCDANLTWSADTATSVWVGNGLRDSITVTFTVSDDCGNADATTATFTLVNDQPPTINCPGDFEEIIAQELCSSTISMDTVSAEDLCSIPVLTWVMTGATTGTGTGQVVNELFNVGKTIIKFTATDDGGLTDTCSFQVWVKHPQFPTDAITCPADTVWANADPANCDASIVLGTVTINDPCNEIDAVWNDSPYAASPSDASGNYPIGVTNFSWYITDVSGNSDTCDVTVVVVDVDAPQFLTCPADTLEDIVDAGACDMSNFNLVNPTWDVGCGASLRYELSGATTGSGSDLIDPAVVHFNVGVTTITYILEDPSGNADTCIFWAWAKHVDFPTATITCPTDTVRAIADPSSCDAGLTLETVTYTDPCNEIDSIWNDSPYATSWSDASGNYPIGITNFAWYILDVSGNTDTCNVTVIVEDIDAPQFMTCPSDTLEDIISAADCDMTNFSLEDPTWDVGCGATLRYELSGATTGSGIDLIDPAVVSFNVGITTITYILTDPSGNADTCIFWAWVKRLDLPNATYNCPQPLWTVDADTDSCNATLTLDKLEIVSDPCNEIDSVWNDSPAIGATADDASGIYDIGSTTFYWYVRDVSNNVNTCEVTVIVNDLLPTLECPPDTIVQADFEVPYKDGVTVDLPAFYDNCPDSVLTYTIEEPDGNVITSATTGINLIPNPRRYQLGVTTITYTFTDAHSHTLSCDFTVTVLGEPEIECPPIDTLYANANCIYPVDPGIPTLLEGVPPIYWTWTITEPDGTVTTGNSTGNAPDLSPAPIGVYDFPLGTTTIEWIAENISGADTCSHTITVIDTIPPTFVSAPIENCVDLLYFALYNTSNPNPNVGVDPNLAKNPSPDYYTFKNGDTSLDITDLQDNCCNQEDMTINWQIDFADTPDPLNPTGPALSHASISGTGQPSDYGSDMLFPGDGVYFNTVTHTITFWVEDCNGNISNTQVQNIVITPRPQITKMN